MDAPLYNKIMKYSKGITSFHMPGHKFGHILNMKNLPIFDLDVTEVEGLDNLYQAEEVILKAQEKMALKYGAKDSIFITNGSTSGIIASILSVCKPGDSLLVARNCHHSVWNALILGGVRPIYIYPSYNRKYSILGGISSRDIKEAIIKNPEVKGLIIVSPTYEGFVSDIESIAKVVHKYGKILIVDEAHGAHFIWDKGFPKSSLELGADIVIQSMHKTLPAISQSALLHIGSNRIDKNDLVNKVQMVQTSSPSYIMMGLMDYVRAKLDDREIWENYTERLIKARKQLKNFKKLQLLDDTICNKSNIYNIDISKLIILTHSTNISGFELSKLLRYKYNIQIELELENYIIAMSTVGDRKRDLDRLVEALLDIDSQLEFQPIKDEMPLILNTSNKEKVIPREIYFSDKEEVYINDSIGRVSTSNLMVYPPGIPLICIGEIFTKETVEYIKRFPDKILGINNKNNKIKVAVSRRGVNNEG